MSFRYVHLIQYVVTTTDLAFSKNPSEHGFLVADAGGGTLDISSYAIRGTSPLVIEEIAPPDCPYLPSVFSQVSLNIGVSGVFAGSVFVSRRARAFFAEKLRNSKYGTSDSLDHIAKRFDETTKRLFRDNKEVQYVPFGSPLDKDSNAGIRAGALRLTGCEIFKFTGAALLIWQTERKWRRCLNRPYKPPSLQFDRRYRLPRGKLR